MTNAYYESTWEWLEDTIDVPDILCEYIDEYGDFEISFDDFLQDIIWDLWDRYPKIYGKLSIDAVADFVSLFL